MRAFIGFRSDHAFLLSGSGLESPRLVASFEGSPTLRYPVIFAPVDIFRYGTERYAGKRADQDYAPMPD